MVALFVFQPNTQTILVLQLVTLPQNIGVGPAQSMKLLVVTVQSQFQF